MLLIVSDVDSPVSPLCEFYLYTKNPETLQMYSLYVRKIIDTTTVNLSQSPPYSGRLWSAYWTVVSLDAMHLIIFLVIYSELSTVSLRFRRGRSTGALLTHVTYLCESFTVFLKISRASGQGLLVGLYRILFGECAQELHSLVQPSPFPLGPTSKSEIHHPDVIQ